MKKRNSYRDELLKILHEHFSQGKYHSVSEFPIDVRVRADELHLRGILYNIDTGEINPEYFKTYRDVFNIVSPRLINDSIAKMMDKHCRS